VPIYLEGRVLGVLDVQSMRYNAFDDHDQTTLRTIADQIALALENARLFKEEHERSQELSVLLSTTRAASSSLVLDDVLHRLAEGLAGATGVPACVICVLDDEAQTITPAASYSAPDSGLYLGAVDGLSVQVEGSPVIAQVLHQSEPFFCCEVPDPASIDGALAEVFGGKGALAVPLAARGKVFGVALLPGDESGEAFAAERIRLIRGVADSAGLAIENARLYEQAQALAIAEERGRIAQEIHDTLAQGLTAISLHLDLADAYLPNKPEQAAEKVRRALELTRQNLEEARRSVLDLRAARQHQTTLPDALRKLVQTFSSDTGLHADFTAEGLTNRLSARVEMGLYRIVEEALANVRCHATTASHVRVRLAPRHGQVSLTIEDDGPGFEAGGDRVTGGGDTKTGDCGCWPSGFGLVSIRERAKLLRGTLDLQSARDKGTTLVVTLPFEGILQRRARTGNEETQG
ncbi:MAG TPA: GAF domain-containing protein, partial [Thermomicrobiaceae bacterium]|nr:GAF domain-containing protein [Thermomicrobiaceae bacterium]